MYDSKIFFVCKDIGLNLLETWKWYSNNGNQGVATSIIFTILDALLRSIWVPDPSGPPRLKIILLMHYNVLDKKVISVGQNLDPLVQVLLFLQTLISVCDHCLQLLQIVCLEFKGFSNNYYILFTMMFSCLLTDHKITNRFCISVIAFDLSTRVGKFGTLAN